MDGRITTDQSDEGGPSQAGMPGSLNKKTLTETDIRSKFITPALCDPGGAGWNLMTQVRKDAYFTSGRARLQLALSR